MTCPWFSKHREHLSDGLCSLYPNDERQNLVHVHNDAQYSVDPATGRPMALTLNNLDPFNMYNFSLNRRICSVLTEIETGDVHIAAYRPRNAIDFWTIVRIVINKWDKFHEDVGYWPSVCTVTDAVLNLERLAADEPACINSLRPVHFVKDCSSFATAVSKLMSVWFKNYYVYVLNVCDEQQICEILSGGGSNEAFATNSSSIKARRIECDAKDHATGFWEKYDPDMYKQLFTSENATDMGFLNCRLKHIMDRTSLSRLQRENNARISGVPGAQEDIDNDDFNPGDANDFVADTLDKPRTILNLERSRSKRLFHAIMVDTFGNHRDYPHTIMCKDFIVQNKRWCSVWLDMVKKFSDYRLCRLKQENTEEEECARNGIRQAMKDWNSLFPTFSESTKQRRRELDKLMRRKKKSDTIAQNFSKMANS